MNEILILIIGFGIFGYLILRISEKLAQQSQINLEQARELREIKEKLSLSSQLQNHLKEGIEKTRDLIEKVQEINKIRQEKEKDFFESLKRIEQIITGTSTKGISGEEILRETFKKLPPQMIETNFKVRGKVVEFALILPNGKKIPIDSKWPATNLILELENENLPQKRKEIIEKIERETIKRIKEVAQYIDPPYTWPQAIAAIPDSVYQVCSQAHLKARENNVILVPYSYVLPLILYMYQIHLQYAISVDVENLQNHLISISQNLEKMENILENKILMGAKMISNAYLDYKESISKIKTSLNQIQIKAPIEKN